MRVLLLSLCVLVLANGATSASDEALTPARLTDPAWTRDGEVRRFEKSDLYGHIDGGAELFHEFGFEYLLVQSYLKAEQELGLEVYVMSSPTSALAIYLMKVSRERTIEGIPTRHTAHTSQFTLLKSKYFIQINNFTGDSAIMPDMVTLSQQVLAAIPDSGPVAGVSFPEESRVLPGSVRLIRGPYSLQSVYTLGSGDILDLRGEVFGVVHDEARPGSDTVTVIVVEYPSEAAAKATLTKVRAQLDATLKVLVERESEFVFSDYRNQFGFVRLAGPILTVEVGYRELPATTPSQ